MPDVLQDMLLLGIITAGSETTGGVTDPTQPSDPQKCVILFMQRKQLTITVTEEFAASVLT